MKNIISMTQFTASVAECLGIPAPVKSDKSFCLPKALLKEDGIQHIQKLLIYNPDAIAMWLYQKYTPWFAPVLRHVQLTVPVCTVLPSVTPVCFGTMYTGVLPKTHGIQKYEKHIISQESLFDCLAESNLRTAIVAVQNSSMAVIFNGRNIDYYTLPYDDEVIEKADELIRGNEYDVVVVYNQEYDDMMHRTFPESNLSLMALKHHISAFDHLCNVADESWKNYDRMVCWASDHGIHTNDEGHGTHGDNVEDDLNVTHFFGAKKKGF